MDFLLPHNFNDEDVRKQIQEIVISPQINAFYMKSPDGTNYEVTMANGGTFDIEEVD